MALPQANPRNRSKIFSRVLDIPKSRAIGSSSLTIAKIRRNRTAVGLAGTSRFPKELPSLTRRQTASVAVQQEDNPVMAVALILVAMAVVPCMDGIAKYLSRDYSVVQIVWARYFFHLLLLFPLLLLRFPLAVLRPKRTALQILRGGLLLLSTIFFFAAISVIPLADAIALVFISPLVVTALSPFFLAERVGIHRFGAVILGMGGALIVLRPGQHAFESAALLAVAAGVVYACYTILTRKLSGSAPALVTLGYTALFGAVSVSLVVPFFWRNPDLTGWLLMAAMGVVAAVGHYFVIKAFELAPASFLAPFGYSEIVMTTIIGYAVFGDFPDYMTWVGIVIIIVSGVYITWREKVRARKVTTRTIPGPDF